MLTDKLVFIVDDEPAILKLLSFWVKDKWKYNIKAFTEPSAMIDSLQDNPDLILLDIMLQGENGIDYLKRIKSINPNLPVIMLSAQGNIQVAIDSIKIGAYDYLSKPIDLHHLEPSIKNAIKNYELSQQLEQLKEVVKREYSFDNIITADSKMQEVFKLVNKVLNNDISVLIHGESGTGKELIARAIHFNGIRKDNPFIVVNCASIPRDLLESELFGHEKGSFTGAHQRKIGKFEIANGGTIFLDEIGELEISLQSKILRVIQNKEFERVGGNEIIKTDARIISATNRNLKSAVDNKEFREDLYYRLNSFPIYLPALRERKGDILVLVEHFLNKFNQKFSRNVKNISKRVLKSLYDYDWPGNIRELENIVERCIILTDSNSIDADTLPPYILNTDGLGGFELNGKIFGDDSPVIPFEKLKEEAIKHALKVTHGNIVEASKKLRIGRATLYRLMDKYHIEYTK